MVVFCFVTMKLPAITALLVSVFTIPCLATQSSEDPYWKTYGETAEGELIELYTGSPQRENGQNIVYFTYRLTEKDGKTKVIKARSTDCFKGSNSWELNGKPRKWAIRSNGQWKLVKITSDATINLLINACRSASYAANSSSRYYNPNGEDEPNPNSLGFIVADDDYQEILAEACQNTRNGQSLSSIRASVWVGLASRSNVTYNRARLERETSEIVSTAVKNCY